MKNKNGFTLVELLVVVLIIGVLAAMALPQYQKAAEKAKAMQAITLLKAIYDAQTRYFLANNTYADKFDELDVTIPANWNGTVKGSTSPAITDTRSNADWSVQIFNDHATTVTLLMSRISGTYAGAVFDIGLIVPQAQISTGRLPGKFHCEERKSGGILYPSTKAPGSYCQKLFHGTIVYGQSSGSARVYTIPDFN